ncbi:2656_t:CDS:10 [Scutellospora calospora]|uniref:2656_t:CDS:1 n=1 Tax=Scutellospora calospora TaxID=85575 RepID=A0ACA9K7N6_9GLOM|nr:2656_t:CDS:10 [Scutellospora calospora]
MPQNPKARSKAKATNELRLPLALQNEIEESMLDARNFDQKFKNQTRGRKEKALLSHAVKIQKTNKGPVTASTDKDEDSYKRKISKIVPAQKLEKLYETNTNFFSLLQDANLVNASDIFSSKLVKSSDTEEREIRRLEKKLGIKSSGKLTKAFAEDGLDDLLEGFEIGSKRSNLSNLLNELSSEQIKDNDNDLEFEESEYSEDCSVIDKTNKDNDDDICEINTVVEVKESDNVSNKITEAGSTQEFLNSSDQLEHAAKVDTDKYIPPHTRDKLATLSALEANKTKTEQQTRLQRQLQGLLNRHTDSGYQLKQDDPSSLKEIIQQVHVEISKKDPKSLVSRTKFMIETIMNLKNNRLKQQDVATHRECILKMKKFLVNLGKKIHVQATEAIRVNLDDIRSIAIKGMLNGLFFLSNHNFNTFHFKGKWWIVGSANMTDSQSTSTTRNTENNSVFEAFLNLAKQQKMNTDVRRSIFIVLMSSEDYIDAFERLLKLDLKEVQAREIPRENTHNPYYSLIAQRLCDYDHSFKVTFKYCLWDFLRECGEIDVGGIEMMKSISIKNSSEKIPLKRIVNLAKLFAWLITVTFTKLQSQSRLFFQHLFSNIILIQNTNKRNPQLLSKIFIITVHIPILAHGIMFFLHHFVKSGDIIKEEEKELVEWGCDVIKKAIQLSLSIDKTL